MILNGLQFLIYVFIIAHTCNIVSTKKYIEHRNTCVLVIYISCFLFMKIPVLTSDIKINGNWNKCKILNTVLNLKIGQNK